MRCLLVLLLVVVLPVSDSSGLMAPDNAAYEGREARASALLRLAHGEQRLEPATTAAVVAALCDSDVMVRATAAIALAVLPVDDSARRSLVAALDDRDLEVRGAAAYALRDLGLVTDDLVPTLRRNVALQAGEARLYTAFALSTSPPRLRADVARAAAIGGTASLFDALQQQTALSIVRIAKALIATDHDVARMVVPRLFLVGTSHPPLHVESNADFALREFGIGWPGIADEPLAHLSSPDAARRKQAAGELRMLAVGTPRVIERLGQCVNASAELVEVRRECILALQRIGSSARQQARRLRRVLHSRDQELRMAAAAALFSVDRTEAERLLPKLQRFDPRAASEITTRIRLSALDCVL